MKGLNLLTLTEGLTEGMEIVYADPRKFDEFGVGTVQGIKTEHLSVPMVEIIFPNALTAESQFLPVKVNTFMPVNTFMERLKEKEMVVITSDENIALRILERELLKDATLEDATNKIALLSDSELSTLSGLLKERVKDESRLRRKEAVTLLGAISEFMDDEKVKELFKFLLEQTETEIKKRRSVRHRQISYGLTVAAQFRREQLTVIAKCLEVAVEMTQRGNEEMSSAVREAAERLQAQAHSSRILKRAAKTALKSLNS